MRRVLKFMAATMAIAVAIGGSGDEAGVTGAVEGAEPVPANSAADARVRGEFPRVVELEGGMVVIHAPQVRSWEDFELIEGLAVVETIPKDARAPRFGILGFSANAVPDLEARTVHLDHIAITSLQEKGEELPVETRELVASALDLGARDIPLDLVLSHLADGVIPANTDSIKMEPPRIIVSTTPAVVVLLQGDPVLAPVADGGLLFAANTNWPLFKVEASGEWYLRNNEQWLVAADLDGPWIWAKDLPAALKNLPDEANWRSTRKAAL
ncbi:MAG: hypothetical protein OES38_23750, partial [Gammaproteobacteria bacterium]|nr:hypothetical protein [Gammaproteobacteria bacterium]